MLKSVPFANSLTIVTAAFYIVCMVFSAVAPDFVIGIEQSWIHTLTV